MSWPFHKKAPPALFAPVAESLDATVARYNRWRDQLNPLRGLTLSSAISMLDRVQAGQTADFAWTCQLIERRDEDLIAVIESTTSALTQLEWRIRTAEGDVRQARHWDAILAADQSNVLLDHYNRSLNIYDVLEHLALSKFRGYSHAQIMADGQWLRTAEIIDQWHVCRDGHRGPWFWNPEAKDLPASSLPPSNRMDESAYLIVETPRPIDEVGLLKYLRCSLSSKDWDAFIEIYGIPSWIITMPPNVPKGKEEEYRDAALSVAKGGSGAIPNGSTASAAGYPAGNAPFRDHLQWWSEKLVLAATGGLLTSVALPTGIGSGASDAHSETFGRIARGRARLISEEFQRKIDRRILDAAFPGRPHLAYFEFSANEATDTGAVIEEITKLASAGYRISSAEASEKTGYDVTDTGAVQPQPGAAVAPASASDGAQPAPIVAPVDVSDVASTALNGAQISSLVSVLSDAASGRLPKGSVIPILQAAFPSISIDTINRIVGPLSSFDPAAPILSRAASASEASPTPAAIEDAAVSALVEARARNLAPVIDRLLAALAETDPAAMHASLSDILDDLPSLAAAAASGADADASLLERILSDAVGAGFASGQARLAKPPETPLPAVSPSTRHPRASKP
jgi:phage gp29-like protein